MKAKSCLTFAKLRMSYISRSWIFALAEQKNAKSAIGCSQSAERNSKRSAMDWTKVQKCKIEDKSFVRSAFHASATVCLLGNRLHSDGS